MTDEEIENHIGLEKVSNVMEGFDRDFGIDEIRELVKEVKHEQKNLKTQKCIKCKNLKEIDSFKCCMKCREYLREYHHKNRDKLF